VRPEASDELRRERRVDRATSLPFPGFGPELWSPPTNPVAASRNSAWDVTMRLKALYDLQNKTEMRPLRPAMTAPGERLGTWRRVLMGLVWR
jgi:hypothetical protein